MCHKDNKRILVSYYHCRRRPPPPPIGPSPCSSLGS